MVCSPARWMNTRFSEISTRVLDLAWCHAQCHEPKHPTLGCHPLAKQELSGSPSNKEPGFSSSSSFSGGFVLQLSPRSWSVDNPFEVGQ